VVDYWVENPLRASLMRMVLGGLEQPSGPLREFREQAALPLNSMIEVGQRMRAVRDNVPRELMLRMLMSILETVDVWFVEHLPTEGPEKMKRETVPMVVDAVRRLASPTSGGV